MTNVLEELYEVVVSRRKNGTPKSSYVAKLSAKGREKIAQKVGEEATETVIASLKEGKKATISESADLLFHLAILWAECGIKPKQVMKELKKRMGTSGLDEKAARKVK